MSETQFCHRVHSGLMGQCSEDRGEQPCLCRNHSLFPDLPNDYFIFIFLLSNGGFISTSVHYFISIPLVKQTQYFKGVELEEMSQLLKCLPYKHENQNLILQNPRIKQEQNLSIAVSAHNLNTGKVERGAPPSAAQGSRRDMELVVD